MGLQSVCAVFCCGLCVVFPFAIVFTGWNEKVAVCRAWAIDGAEQQAVTLKCGQHNTDSKGKALSAGTLGFLSCAVDQSSFKKFTQDSFPGLANVPNLFGATGEAAAAMKMNVKQWQCEESCAESVCEGRRLEEVEQTKADGEAKSVDSSDRRLLSRRLTGAQERNLKGSKAHTSKSCTTRCVRWSHKRVLRDSAQSATYSDSAGAARVCGTAVAPGSSPVKLGTSDIHASGGSISTLPGNHWSINEAQIQELPIEVGVPLTARAALPGVSAATSAPPSLNQGNTYVVGNTLKTCANNNMGCIEISFLKAVPKRVTMLGAVSSMAGQMSKKGWDEAGYWLCKDATENNINRFCPSHPMADSADFMHKGSLSCGEDVTTMDKMMTMMKGANSGKLWGFRIIGFCAFWLSISCCLSPIESVLGFITDLMDDGTDCIPCVGSAVDCLTDIFMGVLKAVLCVVSFCTAVAWFLAVVTGAWFVMRPVMGAMLAVVACCFCIGAGLILNAFRGGGKNKKQKLSGEDGESEGEQEEEAFNNEEDQE